MKKKTARIPKALRGYYSQRARTEVPYAGKREYYKKKKKKK